MPYLVLLLRTVFKIFVRRFINLSTKESGWMALSRHKIRHQEPNPYKDRHIAWLDELLLIVSKGRKHSIASRLTNTSMWRISGLMWINFAASLFWGDLVFGVFWSMKININDFKKEKKNSKKKIQNKSCL